MKKNQAAEELLQLCKKNHWRLALAESCTGGAMAVCLTSIPGASQVFAGSIVCYQEHVKTRVLGVSAEMIEEFGVVSDVVARQMLIGCLDVMSADIGIAVTGVAGPGGGSDNTPVGTVYLATGKRDEEPKVQRLKFNGTRTEIIQQVVERALSEICDQRKSQTRRFP